MCSFAHMQTCNCSSYIYIEFSFFSLYSADTLYCQESYSSLTHLVLPMEKPKLEAPLPSTNLLEGKKKIVHVTEHWWSSVEWNVTFICLSRDVFVANQFFIYLNCFFLVQYSVFGSILTIGGVIGGLISGKMADLIGRRGVSFFCHIY